MFENIIFNYILSEHINFFLSIFIKWMKFPIIIFSNFCLFPVHFHCNVKYVVDEYFQNTITLKISFGNSDICFGFQHHINFLFLHQKDNKNMWKKLTHQRSRNVKRQLLLLMLEVFKIVSFDLISALLLYDTLLFELEISFL